MYLMGKQVKGSDVCVRLSARDCFATIVSKSLLCIQTLSEFALGIDADTHTQTHEHTHAMTL